MLGAGRYEQLFSSILVGEKVRCLSRNKRQRYNTVQCGVRLKSTQAVSTQREENSPS